MNVINSRITSIDHHQEVSDVTNDRDSRKNLIETSSQAVSIIKEKTDFKSSKTISQATQRRSEVPLLD